MKKLLSIITVTAFVFSLSAGSFAAEKKEKPADAAKPAPEKVAGEAKPIPMNLRADAIDAGAKTITTKRKDGVEVKHVVTDKTEIKNGEAAAKFEDIKVGDQIGGLRVKKSDTEYEIVKITKFGAKGDKKAEAKPADKKAQ